MSEDKPNSTEEKSDSLSKTAADEEIKTLEQKVTELGSEKNAIDQQAQSEWDQEAKRIQEIRNAQNSSTSEPQEEKIQEVISELLKEPEPTVESAPEPTVESAPEPTVESAPEVVNEIKTSEVSSASLLETVSDAEVNSRISFEEFTDERILISHDAFGNKQMKIKVLEVSDENPAAKWKFGDRVKVTKILVTIKHLTTQEVEEGEFDIEAIERELAEKRHYTSTNRWIPASDIKNGYVIGSRHTRLISDASALDYIVF